MQKFMEPECHKHAVEGSLRPRPINLPKKINKSNIKFCL